MTSASGSQTVGPFVRIGFRWLAGGRMAAPGIKGERVAIRGGLVDGDGAAVSDGVIEVWQADAAGRYAHPDDPRGARPVRGLRGFGRALTDARGAFGFSTIRPGRVPGPEGALQAPHLAVTVFMRGLLKQLWTRMYFPDDPANEEDPILARVPAARRATLIARRRSKGVLEWNIVLQGRNETVFFDY